MTTLPEEVKNAVAKALRESRWLVPAPAVELILTAALPFLSVQGAVKKLEWELVSGDHYAEGAGTHYNIYETKPGLWNSVTVKPGNVRLATNVGLEAAKAAAQADYEARILSALEPSEARSLALEEEFATVRAMIYCYEGDSAQAFEAQKALAKIDAALASLSSPDHADGSKSTSDQKVCQTCNDRGIIGGMHRVGDGDVDAWEETCPDCQKVKAHHSDADTGPDDQVQIALHLNCEPDADSILHVIREIQADIDIAKHADAGKVEGDGKPVAYLRPKDIERLAKPGVSGAINVQIANVPFIGCTVPVFAALPSAPASEGAE